MPLVSEALGLIGKPEELEAVQDFSVDGLRRLPLITPTSPNRSRAAIEAVLGDLTPALIAEVDCLPAMLDIIAGGDAFCLMPFSSVHTHVRAGTLAFRELGLPLRRKMVLVRPRERPVSVATTMVEKSVRELVRDLAASMRWCLDEAEN